ncbi:MAG: helicase-related protein [Methanothrix sp.]|nr:helicase-related protein [Methanothrix sp.]
MLIADDVGVGKTIETCLIVKELLERGEIHRFTVLAPAHLAEQWQRELDEKFHIETELVLPGTVRSLEASCATHESVFERYPFTIVSMDYIKSDAHRAEFQRACPEMVIVDEAHGCAYGATRGSGKHQRNQLVSALSRDSSRHMILVTATPHSGNEDAFRSLLTLLKPEFAELPQELAGPQNEPRRRELSKHFIQRTRGDVMSYLDSSTAFPMREDSEHSYSLAPDYRNLFDRVLNYARESIDSPSGGQREMRVRYWSALALLRSLASSPRAASVTLRNRANTVSAVDVEEADELGRQAILDLDLEQGDEAMDISPGGEIGELSHEQADTHAGRLRRFALEADMLEGSQDRKLNSAAEHLKKLLDDRWSPIVFCRFIDTAEYVAEHLKKAFPRVEIDCVTGRLNPADRELRITELSAHFPRILVCTDCLSEGINLQDSFDAVFHYDLSWNPMRHEQRAGRVDRFGQKRSTVKVLTFFGADNTIDAKVLEVLLRKHRSIRSALGISVPVPTHTNEVIEALVESLLRGRGEGDQMVLGGLEEYLATREHELFQAWEDAKDRLVRSRSIFAQLSIHPEEVAQEYREAQAASGSQEDARSFFLTALEASGAVITGDDPMSISLRPVPRALKEAISASSDDIRVSFRFPPQDEVTYLSRTHPCVEGLASHVLDCALDPLARSVARRCGVVRISEISTRTTLLLLRYRFHIVTTRSGEESRLLAESCHLMAFRGSADRPEWLDTAQAEALLELKPSANTPPDTATSFLEPVIAGFEALRSRVDEEARTIGNALLESHRRVRSAAQLKGVSVRIEHQRPTDLLGVFIYLPIPRGGEA